MSIDREAFAAMIAAAFGGQQQQEHITYNTHTQVWVPFMEFVGVLGSMATILLGFAAIGLGLFWTAQQATVITDRLLISAGIATASMLLLSAERAIRRRFETAEFWHTIAGFMVRVGFLLLGLDLIYWLVGAWRWQQTVVFVAGMAAIPSASLLIWRYANELFNPLYPRSPWASLIERFLGAVAGEREPIHELVPYPVYMRNNVPEVQPPDDSTPWEVSPSFSDFAAFLALARKHGITRKSLVVDPHYILPSGQEVTRPVWETMIALGERWEFVKRGGGGDATEWIIEPDQAIHIIGQVLDTLQPGRQPGRQAP